MNNAFLERTFSIGSDSDLGEDMLRHLRLMKRFRFWRWVNIMSEVLVFSYVAFDVLDLDLSDFPLNERMLIITEASKATEMVHTLNWNGFHIVPSLLQTSLFKETIRIQQKNILRASRFREARILFPPADHPAVFHLRLVSSCLKLYFRLAAT